MATTTLLEVLVVEDDTEAGTAIQRALSDLGYAARHASTGEVALEAAEEKKPQLAIVAAGLGGDPDGLKTARQLASQGISLLFLAENLQDARPLLDLRPLGGLVKPLREGELEVVLAMAKSLAAEREQLSALAMAMETVTEGIFLLDHARRIVFANAAALRMARTDAPAAGQPLEDYFPTSGGRNAPLAEALDQILSGYQTDEAGLDAILHSPEASASKGKPEGLKVRLWAAPASSAGMTLRFQLPARVSESASANRDEKTAFPMDGMSPTQHPIRDKAIRAIELRMEAAAGINHYAAVFTLSQFDTFWTRYGLSNAENLVDAYAAHLTRTFPNDRIYRWSNRVVALLLDRQSTPPDVRMELTSFTTRRVDYYLNTVGRSALVTLSPAWRLIALNCDPELTFDTEEIIRRIDQFEADNTRIR